LPKNSLFMCKDEDENEHQSFGLFWNLYMTNEPILQCIIVLRAWFVRHRLYPKRTKNCPLVRFRPGTRTAYNRTGIPILSSLSNQDFDCVHKLYKFGRLISFLLKCKATFEEVDLVGQNVVSNSHVCMCVNENALFCYLVEYLRHCSATLNGSTFIHTNHSFHHCPKFPPKGSSRSQIASLKHFLKWPWLCHNALVREKWSIVINWWQNFHSFSSFMPLSG